MPKYIVQHFYKSDVAQYPAGQVVEMDAELAAWFNRDSPGVLKLGEPPLPVEESRLDRMIRKAKTRS
jgi:hypothetical protein